MSVLVSVMPTKLRGISVNKSRTFSKIKTSTFEYMKSCINNEIEATEVRRAAKWSERRDTLEKIEILERGG